jgi:hypothetical protein
MRRAPPDDWVSRLLRKFFHSLILKSRNIAAFYMVGMTTHHGSYIEMVSDKRRIDPLYARDIGDKLYATLEQYRPCAGCGCTHVRPCEGGCYRIAPGICSRCQNTLMNLDPDMKLQKAIAMPAPEEMRIHYHSDGTAAPDEDIEKIAHLIHGVYMEEARRQNDVRHPEPYDQLTDKMKNYDRALARFILKNITVQISERQPP